MSLLTGPEIKKQVELGRIAIQPFDEKNLNPNSYNLHLGNKMVVYRRPGLLKRALLRLTGKPWCLDVAKYNPIHQFYIPLSGYVLQPGRLYLGSTEEFTGTDRYAPMIEGRSSLARLGIWVHFTAGFGDVGFQGRWTLEIAVKHPVRVYPGIGVCQIAYHEVVGDVQIYDGKYKGQTAPTPSGMWKEL